MIHFPHTTKLPRHRLTVWWVLTSQRASAQRIDNSTAHPAFGRDNVNLQDESWELLRGIKPLNWNGDELSNGLGKGLPRVFGEFHFDLGLEAAQLWAIQIFVQLLIEFADL